MKRIHRQTLLLVMLCALLLLATSVAYAGATAARISWWTVDGGGGRSTSSHLILNGTIGQADAGYASSEHTRLYGGFWGFGSQEEVVYRVYLPITNR